MTAEIRVNVAGNVASEPERRRTPSGVPLASFRLACNAGHRDRRTGQWVEDATNFFTVTCWRDLGENVAQSLEKGHPVLVQGYLQQKTHQREDGSRAKFTDIVAQAVGHDLSRGTARFERVGRSSEGGNGVAGRRDTGQRSSGQAASASAA
jgi:single-strand DNA-binding protein